MKPLFALFWQICRFRRGPEDVPYSSALAGLLILVVAGLAGASVMVLTSIAPPASDASPTISPGAQLLAQWLALAAWILAIFLLLRFKKLSARFTQTLVAALGTDILISLPQLFSFVLMAANPPESVLGGIAQFNILFCYIWDMLIKGHIYSRAMNISRLQGNLLSLALSFGIFALSSALIPVSPQ